MKHRILTTAVVLCVVAGGSLSPAMERQNRKNQNPFAPLDKRAAPESSRRIVKRTVSPPTIQDSRLQLQGIIWNAGSPMAIIDGAVVNVGDSIMDRTVIHISVNAVELEYRGKTETLRIVPDILFTVTEQNTDGKTVPKGRITP